MIRLASLAGLLALLASFDLRAADDAAPAVTITADWSEAPDLETWAKEAQVRCDKWHPLICRALGREGEPEHKEIAIIVRPMRGIAATSGAKIRVSADYVHKHPDDDGMIVHELVHVVQAYPSPNPIWLTEGIADYVRYWHYEPGRRDFRIVKGRSSYRDSYGTTARFLAWVQVAKDAKIIHKLDAAMHRGEYRDALFEEATGKSLEELWSEFVDSAARDRVSK
jgi:hypothetical protein